MGTLWVVLFVLLWCFTLLGGLLLLGVIRQLGVLHHRLDDLNLSSVDPFADQGLEPGTRAPDFTLQRVGGGRLSLSDFRGRPILLAFIRLTCGSCVEFAPQLNAFVHHTDVTSLQVLIVSTGEMEDNERFRMEHALLPPVVVQEGKEVSDIYKARFTPYVYVIDAHGMVRTCGLTSSGEQVAQLLAFARVGEFDGETGRELVTVHGKAGIA